MTITDPRTTRQQLAEALLPLSTAVINLRECIRGAGDLTDLELAGIAQSLRSIRQGCDTIAEIVAEGGA